MSERGPLIVELEGTLLRFSLMWELAIALFKRHWRLALRMPFWLRHGKQAMAERIAAHSGWNAAHLPYDRTLLDFLAGQHRSGRALVLLTSLPPAVAHDIGAHLGLFETIHPQVRDKAALLRSLYAAGEYEYLGGAGRAGWRHTSVVAMVRALRPRQWLKNLLVFAPMAAAHALTTTALTDSLLAFAVFSACASSAYLLNDALDVHDDRIHPSKRHRPIAAGLVSVPAALLLAVVLAASALALAFRVSPLLGAVALGYYVSTVAYSVWLKRLPMIDIVTLAVLYCLRILAGGAATGIEPSFWLLAFSFFLFLSLALLKRHSELSGLDRRGRARMPGRGYHTDDHSLVAMMGVNSAFLSVLIVILYFQSENVARLYTAPRWLLPVIPVLVLWLGRLWMLSFRGRIHEDPLLFVSRDRFSLAVIALCAALCIAAA